MPPKKFPDSQKSIIEAGNAALIFGSDKKIPTGVTIQILTYLNK